MLPPSAECKRLAQLDPMLRFGWAGRDRETEDELNAGQFVLVRLMPRRKVKGGGDSWFCEWGINEDAGPLFNKFGGTIADWGPELVPVIDSRIPENETYMVMTGDFVSRYRRRMAPKYVWDAAHYDAAKRAGQRKEEKLQATIDEVAGAWWMEANKHSERAPMLLKEEVRAGLGEDWQRIHERDASFENFYVEKHGLKAPAGK